MPRLTDLTGIEGAIRDALHGWRYLREYHGDLYGVGWERVEMGLVTALHDLDVIYLELQNKHRSPKS